MAKKGLGKRKGSQWEREFCKTISLWWTHGRRNDAFWRSHASGARATTRQKAGQDTRGQYGDVSACDPSGVALIDLITFELKKGYPKANLSDLVDRPDTNKPQIWEDWIDDAMRDAENSGSYTWAIVLSRTRREPLIVFPHELVMELHGIGALKAQPCPYITITTFLRRKKAKNQRIRIAGMLLSHFLTAVSTDHVRELSRRL